MASAVQPNYPAVYRACMKEAAAQGRPLMQRVVARALLEMPRRAAVTADVVDRNLLAEAARVLAHHETKLVDTFPQALLQEFAHAIAGDTRKAAGVSFDSLELLGEEQVQEGVEVVRAQQLVQAAVDAQLAELNALVSAVQGLPSVQAERNPLRPEVYVRALRTVVQQSPVSASVRRRWLLNLGEAMGPELAFAYHQLAGFLRSQGVSEVGFVPAGAAGAPGPAPEDKALLNVRELRRLLAGDIDGARGAAPAHGPADFSVTMPAAFEALQEMRQVDAMMQRLRERQARGDGLQQALRAEAKTPAQQLGLEVVNLMVENIAADARLLPSVQRAVRDLEPVLLRLALVDPRFFSDRKHPARQLLEEMTQRSLAWAAEDARGFPGFILPLKEAVQALRETNAAGAEPFDIALKTLQEAWGEAQQRDRRRREKAVRVLVQAEQRNLVAEKVAQQLRGRADVASAPPYLRHFLTGPWSQVMAQARLADASGTPDPEGYTAAIAELVAVAAQRARLSPALLERVRKGLVSIEYPAAQVQRFVERLATAQPPQQAQPDDDGFGDDTWLGPSEAQQSNFMSMPGAGADEPPLPDIGLAPGTWVELFADAQWGRWQLTWASPHGTLLMFTHASGKRQSMTQRLAHKLLAAGALKLVSSQAVVDNALDAVADRAIRNSL